MRRGSGVSAAVERTRGVRTTLLSGRDGSALRRLAAGVIIASFLFAASPAAAGVNRWTNNGPDGGEILALHVPTADPETVYAITSSGALFRSETAGEPAWTAIGRLPEFKGIRLSSDPANAELLYAAVAGPGRTFRFFRSTDGGRTWSASSDANSFPGVLQDLAFVQERVGFAATLDGLFITRDGGESWAKSRGGPHAQVVARGGAVYVTTRSVLDHLYVSTDLGQTWRQITSNALLFALSPTGQTMWKYSNRMVERSRDGGVTWQFVQQVQDRIESLSGTDDRIFVSDDRRNVHEYRAQGGRWSRIGAGSGASLPFAAAPSALYVGTEAGVLVSSSHGDDGWRLVTSGMPQGVARSIAPVGDAGVYVATAAGVFRSDDGGETWRDIEGVSEPNAVSVGGDTLYVASQSGIHRSAGGGEALEVVSPRPAKWVGTSSLPSGTLYADFVWHLERSRDDGRSWSDAPMPAYFDSAIVDPDDAEKIYAAVSWGWDYPEGANLIRSAAGGDEGSWSFLFEEQGTYFLTAGAVRGDVVQAALDCRYNNPLGCGITTSTDAGSTWSAPRLADERIRAIAIDPKRPWRSYAGTESGRVYRSEDFGDQWTPFGEQLPGAVRRLTVSNSGDRVFAGTAAGVYMYDIAPQLAFERLPDDGGRLPALMNELFAQQQRPGGTAAGYLIPAAGTVRGTGGVTFHTDVTLANGRPAAQDVVLVWLPQGNNAGANVPAFRLSIPPTGGADDGVITLSNLSEDLGVDGVGSILVFAIGGDGRLDGNADIDGTARIRSRSKCGGWVSQTFAVVPAAGFGTARGSRILGLRHEPSYRTNVGIVNLSASPRVFTVVAKGKGEMEQFTMNVPPFAPQLAGIPNRDYGSVSLTVTSDGGTAPWISYGSSVDNVSGDAWAVVARPLPIP